MPTDSAAAWSPDGNWIAFSRHDSIGVVHRGQAKTTIELIHPDGSDLHTIAICKGILCNQVMQPVWSPDGSHIAYAPKSEHGPSIAIVTPKGSGTTIRTCANAHCVTPTDLVWAPDGRSLGLLSEARSSTAYAIHTSGGGMHPVGDDAQCCLAWLSSR